MFQNGGSHSMPLTRKGEKILHAMQRSKSKGGYGPDKGKKVFYASINAGKITGAHKAKPKRRTVYGT
jgi:hypothetical protein